MPLKTTISMLNPKDQNVPACRGEVRERLQMCMAMHVHAQGTGCIGLKVDIKSSLTRLSSKVLVIPHLLLYDCLTPATQGPCGSNMISSRDMTSSFSSKSPPFLFGCNPFQICCSHRRTAVQLHYLLRPEQLCYETFVLMIAGSGGLLSLLFVLKCHS